MFTLWNDKKLAEALREDRVSEKTRLTYFCIFMVLMMAMTTSFSAQMMMRDALLNTYDYIIDFIMVFTTPVVLIFLYTINKAGDNKNFFDRYICLSFPAGIKSAVYIFVPFISLIIIISILFAENCYDHLPSKWCEQYIELEKSHVETTSLDFSFFIALMLCIYWRMFKAFKIASGQQDV